MPFSNQNVATVNAALLTGYRSLCLGGQAEQRQDEATAVRTNQNPEANPGVKIIKHFYFITDWSIGNLSACP